MTNVQPVHRLRVDARDSLTVRRVGDSGQLRS